MKKLVQLLFLAFIVSCSSGNNEENNDDNNDDDNNPINSAQYCAFGEGGYNYVLGVPFSSYYKGIGRNRIYKIVRYNYETSSNESIFYHIDLDNSQIIHHERPYPSSPFRKTIISEGIEYLCEYEPNGYGVYVTVDDYRMHFLHTIEMSNGNTTSCTNFNIYEHDVNSQGFSYDEMRRERRIFYY